jgi:hypothetical protein
MPMRVITVIGVVALSTLTMAPFVLDRIFAVSARNFRRNGL